VNETLRHVKGHGLMILTAVCSLSLTGGLNYELIFLEVADKNHNPYRRKF
jgi:hypothetical protein